MIFFDKILSELKSALGIHNLALEKPKDESHGDFATNIAMQMAKEFGKNPRDIAAEFLPKITALPFIESAEIAGPGFINLKIKNDFLIEQLQTTNYKPQTTKPQIINVDYAGYNVGKESHIGHLRVSIIGDAFVRIGRYLGHKMIGYNHMGDWGKNMALVIAGIIDRHPNDWNKPEFNISLKDVNLYYIEATTRAKEDPEYLARVHTIKAELQKKHPEYFTLYEKFLKVSLDSMHEVMRRLNMLKVDNDLGERHAADYIGDVEKILREKNMLVMSDGAEVIPVRKDNDIAPMPPYMFRDSRGATTYDSADIAMAYYRKITDNPDVGIYFVDVRQTLHFEQLFRVLDKMGLFPYGSCEHLPYGVLKGKDGKTFKTRDGSVAMLADMIDMTEEAARKRVLDSGKNLPEDTIKMIALSALKFNDFMHELKSDYIFDLDTVTSFEGRTGPYILYTAVRLNSALARATPPVAFGDAPPMGGNSPPLEGCREAAGRVMTITNDYERDLIIKLLEFPRMIQNAFDKRAIDILANYTYELAQLANVFYHNCPIKDDANRTAIAKKTADVLTNCIDLMGLKVPKEM